MALIFSLQHALLPAHALLVLIGILGGFFVVAAQCAVAGTRQTDRRRRECHCGAKTSVKNLAMLLMLGLYSLAVKSVCRWWDWRRICALFALAITGLWLWQRRRLIRAARRPLTKFGLSPYGRGRKH